MGISIIRRGESLSREWEFSWTDKNSEGKYYPYPKNTSYVIYEYDDKSIMYVDSDSGNIDGVSVNGLIKYKNFTLYDQYIGAKINLSREKYLKPYRPIITEKMREQETISRYFVKYKLDNNSIFEVSEKMYNQAGDFYDKVYLEFQLQGSKDVVSRLNISRLIIANIKLKGIRSFLNPLEFYIEELTPEQIKLKRTEELIKQDGYTFVHGHNPHSHPLEDMFIDEESNQPIVTVPISMRSTTTTGRTGY
jgi:hypothetical protein